MKRTKWVAFDKGLDRPRVRRVPIDLPLATVGHREQSLAVRIEQVMGCEFHVMRIPMESIALAERYALVASHGCGLGIATVNESTDSREPMSKKIVPLTWHKALAKDELPEGRVMTVTLGRSRCA